MAKIYTWGIVFYFVNVYLFLREREHVNGQGQGVGNRGSVLLAHA